MNCAAEFVAMKNIAIAEYELEEKRKDAEAIAEHKIIVEKTINFCDTCINDLFCDLAKNRKTLLITLKFCPVKNRMNYQHVSLLVEDTPVQDRKNYTTYDSNIYDLSTLKEYLEKHCFAVEAKNDYFYQWGCGVRKFDCTNLTICVPKSPCESQGS
jgi:hypothetical protein